VTGQARGRWQRTCRVSVAVACASLAACVQKAYERTVVFVVDVSRVPNVSAVGVRGEGAPLSWQRDTPMTPVKDSAGLYTATVTARTGFLATEVKFVVNGMFEFSGTADESNRIVQLPRTTTGGDTVRFRAVFNSRD
jgi:putative oxidoreductase